MKLFFTVVLITLTISANSQILNRIKNKVTGKAKSEVDDAKYEARNKAREAAYKELDDFKAEYDSTDIDYALLLSDNSGLFGGRGRHETSTKFIRLVTIGRSLYKDQDLSDEENARLNLQMGQSAYATGRFVYAAKRLSTAQHYFEQAGLTRDFGYLKAIASQGLLFTSMGRFSHAEKFTARALEMRKERLGATNISVAASLNNYAVLHYNLGQYNESESEFNESLRVIEANDQKDAMPYAILLNNQAILCQSIGRYDQAISLLKQALQLAGTIEVTKARYHLKFFSNLALLYQQMGKYAEAEEIYQGLEERLERNTPEFANFLNNVAILAMLMKKEDRVEQMLKQSAEIYKSTLTENSPAYAKVVCDLGNFYRYKGRYQEATPLLEQALRIREESLGQDHPLYVQTEEDLAVLKWKNNDLSGAIPLYRTVMGKTLDFINRYFPPMSEAEKTRYWDIIAPRFERFYNFAIESSVQNNGLLNDLFEYRMATKGLLLSSTKKVSESILNSGNDALVRDYSEWLDSKELLTTLYAYSREDLKEQNINVDSLEQATNAMEKRLSQNSSEFSRLMFASKTRPEDLKKVLGPDDVLVEMIRLRKFDQVFGDQVQYAALVLTRDMAVPELVVMSNGNDMEGKFAKTYRLSMKNKVNDVQSFENFWARVDPRVNGKKKIFFSPDGVYNQINLYTLRNTGGDYLINQYDIVLIGNPRDLVTHESRNQMDRSKKATLLGFPDFGGGGLIVQLPGTKTEVDAIQKLLKSSGFQVSELVQREATETNLKSSRRVSILHIATHGYFLQDVDKASWPIGVHADYARNNVLLRSGLMLTGASEADKLTTGLDSTNNGIMTSYEAMNLDLKGTNLVVLSACETGLGEVKAGEGVYGLQRAFLVAGAEAIIMSLWKVDDEATQQLMNNFYSNWVATNDRQKAFKQAQQQLMTKFKEPLYWGAFVMIED